jgi:Cof subfamily protein (haloacid dehalogenase superfamily)
MIRKLVLFDIDSTLIDHTTTPSSIPGATIEAIRQLKNCGHHVGLATGRSKVHSDFIMKKLDMNVAVSFGGHMVEVNNHIIFKEAIHKEEAIALLKDVKHSLYPAVAMNEDTIYVKDFLGTVKRQMSNRKRCIYGEPLAGDVSTFKKLDYHHREYFSMMLFKKKIHNEHQFKHLDFNAWGNEGFEIYAKGVSKYSGIKILAKNLHIKMEDVVVFGDGYNDIQMLKNIKSSVAVGNGVDAAKDAASYVCPPINEGGILVACKKLELI